MSASGELKVSRYSILDPGYWMKNIKNREILLQRYPVSSIKHPVPQARGIHFVRLSLAFVGCLIIKGKFHA